MLCRLLCTCSSAEHALHRCIIDAFEYDCVVASNAADSGSQLGVAGRGQEGARRGRAHQRRARYARTRSRAADAERGQGQAALAAARRAPA
eukprot:6173297-Pleurochrysis_carterae.AAC.1